MTAIFTRRDLLRGSGGLIVSFSLAAAFRQESVFAQESATPAGRIQEVETPRDVSGETIDSWLEVAPDGCVIVYAGKVELGTGLQTALTQIVAEELDVPFERVSLIMGDTALTPNQGGTVGSKSIQNAGPVLRQAAAEARLALLTRAAERLGVSPDDLQARDGVVSVLGDESASVTYAELVIEPFGRGVSGEAPVKSPSQYTIVGQPIERVDIPAKLTGGEAYVRGVRLDGMLHGRVIRPHVRTLQGAGGAIDTFDDSAARGMPGVVDVVRRGNFVGVVAEREEAAIRAAEAIQVTWISGSPLPSQERIYELLREIPLAEEESGEIARNGDVDSALTRYPERRWWW